MSSNTVAKIDFKKALLQGAVAPKLEAIAVPAAEWGFQVLYIAELDADQRNDFENAWLAYREAEGDDADFRMFAVVSTLCDEDRELLFNSAERSAAIERFKTQSSKTLARLFNMTSRVNGLTMAELEKIEKKFESPEPSAGKSASRSRKGSPAAEPGSDPSPRSTTPSSSPSLD